MTALISTKCPESISQKTRSVRFFEGYDPSGHFSHVHPQIELVCVLSGRASVLVGGHVEQSSEGDVFLIGGGLAHSIHHISSEIKIVIVHFEETFLEDLLMIMTDFQPMGDFTLLSNQGTLWRDEAQKLIPEILKLKTAEGVTAMILLVGILTGLMAQKTTKRLNKTFQGQKNQEDYRNEDKIKMVFDYTDKHYRESITLPQIASLVNFTITSFCRYFKKWTGKNYYQYLNDLRISKACSLLSEDVPRNVEEVCYMIGYSSPSTFYKHFKKVLHMTPKEYQVEVRRAGVTSN